MNYTETFIIPPFLISKEIINFFGNKKIIIHYMCDVVEENYHTKFSNPTIKSVYTLDKNDIGNPYIKTFWIKEEIPNTIQNILIEMLKIETANK